MPEFEDPAADSNQKINYTPSTDAAKKPRTRRRSGGFKTEYAAPNDNIGEVNPAEALKSEKLSGGVKPEPKKEKRAPKANRPEPKTPKAAKATQENAGNPQPSPATLAAIARVETRLTERKADRDAKKAEREKNRPAKAKEEKKPAVKRAASPKKPAQESNGIIASILKFFGLGPKTPAKKQGGNGRPRGGKSQGGGRPQGKGGGKGQNRRGQGGSGGSSKGRRRSGKGPRKSDRRTNETAS